MHLANKGNTEGHGEQVVTLSHQELPPQPSSPVSQNQGVQLVHLTRTLSCEKAQT